MKLHLVWLYKKKREETLAWITKPLQEPSYLKVYMEVLFLSLKIRPGYIYINTHKTCQHAMCPFSRSFAWGYRAGQAGLHQTQTLRKPRFPRNLRATLSWLNMSRSSQATCGSLLVIQSPFRLQLCLHKEEVASPELQGCKGSETRVQSYLCVQPCKTPWDLPLKYLVLDLTSCGPGGSWGSAEMQ